MVDIPARKGRPVEIFRFHEMLGAPQVNGDVGRDWDVVEERIGCALPGDYKRFVSAYGPGCINEQLYIFHPRSVDDANGLLLDSLWSQAAYSYAELSQSSPDLYPYPVYPAVGGGFPVARSISGNHVFLMPPGRPSADWYVVVEMGESIAIDASFTDFLWAALVGELGVPVVEGEPSFERVGEVEAC
ncbi:SMI1/KNR4 family protein [Streptomyces sp. NPDC057428]|uniref:SMI1/KNR4 family protein n=1 Tax=Streptomyces sp. NPDC057428 TaxID=3346129 RepID=UPI003685F8F3